ncbi:flagellar basal body rod protein FlgB [Niveibacterium umoris]|uniref:Flagellar basal body rod protein FlgB n=1 Tax=Niveibacterium umoris TaxID=1193620 RepID=A0A840BHP5_9RHOO|nr:flagellar basal body rod protein FlgB [Niveibacterium umoris]MBB4011129.1 flagellar basal-body rod protein FlgB [Niveibacterium umoris]
MTTTAIDRHLGFQQAALNARAYRQELLAANIANADTPHYKARDIDFKEALMGALDGKVKPLALNTTSARHIDAGEKSPMSPFVKYRQETQSAVDGNTVDMDIERSAFAENAVQYEASLSFINGLLRSMQQAVSNQ